MATIETLYSINNPVFSAYLFYCSILCFKVLLMVALIGKHRFEKQIFLNPEDTKVTPNGIVKHDDPDIERVRRAHLNDLENIPIFAILSLLYIATNPSYYTALMLFRVFTITRCVYSFIYAVVVVAQPARLIIWLIPYTITLYMGCIVVIYSLFL